MPPLKGAVRNTTIHFISSSEQWVHISENWPEIPTTDDNREEEPICNRMREDRYEFRRRLLPPPPIMEIFPFPTRNLGSKWPLGR